MRILLISNAAWVGSGYGTQTRRMVPRWTKAGYPTAVLAYFGLEGGSVEWQGITHYAKHLHQYGQDIASAHAVHWQADIIMSLMDLWVCEPRLYSGIPYCPYFPIDMEPLPEPIRQRAALALQPIVMSRFGERVARAAGLDVRYAPHMVETQLYRPIGQGTARERLNLPADAFIVGMVAANIGQPSRKALPQNIEAFALLKRRHPDALLVLHTSMGLVHEHGGINLHRLCERYGLRPGLDVIFCDQHLYAAGLYGDEHMVCTYNALDVLLLVSRGEGFGIPLLEAQSCGTPVVTGDWTAMSELCFAGWTVDKADALREETPLEAWWYLARPEAIAERLESAYGARGERRLRAQARKGALAYDADRVVQSHWRPIFAEIAGALAERGQRVTFAEAVTA